MKMTRNEYEKFIATIEIEDEKILWIIEHPLKPDANGLFRYKCTCPKCRKPYFIRISKPERKLLENILRNNQVYCGRCGNKNIV